MYTEMYTVNAHTLLQLTYFIMYRFHVRWFQHIFIISDHEIVHSIGMPLITWYKAHIVNFEHYVLTAAYN